MKTHLVSLFTAFLLSAPAWAQNVLVVDSSGGPGTDFASLDDAIPAAGKGDVLLVRSGDYELFLGTKIEKSLVIQADSGATVRIIPGLVVSKLPVDDSVVVRGVTLESTTDNLSPGDAIRVEDCEGSVWFEECNAPGPVVLPSGSGGASVVNSASVVFNRCRFGPVSQRFLAYQNSITLLAFFSTVHLFACELTGADGIDTCTVASRSAPGIEVRDGEVWITGSTVRGGSGASGVFGCPTGGDGACALVLTGTNAFAFLQDSQLSGGTGGAGFTGFQNGLSVPGIQAPAGSVSFLAGTARRLETSSPVRDDERSTMSFHGVRGDHVWVLVSLDPAERLLSPFVTGALLLDRSRLMFHVGTVDASGNLVLSVGRRRLLHGAEAASFHLQALFWNPALRQRVLSNPSAVQLIDGAF